MDSVTQAALGATVAGAIAGNRCNAKVLLTGAALGTLPDLDVVLDYGDAVQNTIKHRGFSHSLLTLPPLAFLISWLYCVRYSDSFWTLARVFFLTVSVLVTHTLLDAMTTYGTQLIWPFEGYFELRNVFIIDPLYTLPLLFAIGVALIFKHKGGRWCQGVVLLSTLYLGWGYASQQVIADRVEQNLAAQNLPNQQVLITPTAFNTFLWRVVVMDDGQYWEGLASVLDSDNKIDFISRPLGNWPLEEKPNTLEGLKAFSHNYLNYRVEDDTLIVSDLRLGMANNLSFEFVFAEKDSDGEWKLLEATQRYPSERGLDMLAPLWQRLKGDQTIDANLQTMEVSYQR
ncbi:metal-dependent hydrolase [Vibrio sp. D404a]|uniref:metal-dependent hydrolase n=1 Tax=unclassified Vibrio TaxID=2614977 RepID=UPI002552116A|nr:MULTISPECIES: metal-dependent hydrolase [unclassified Vibrio]MDK9736079.1 metal-dependent hydrolase [Vibrio sp. D404a]MDK9797755.1 metal-dependent hydrolase [Vibrio sp. D449a]